MLLDYYDEFQKYFLQVRLSSYAQRGSQFIGGPANTERAIVDFRKLDKGCEMWVEGFKYPYRGHSGGERVAITAQTKRLFPILLKTTKRKIFFILNIDGVIDWLHYYLSDAYFQENEYSQPVREIYQLVKDTKVRDIVCAILEHDSAYRFRFQDAIVTIDKSKGVVWNLKRILDTLIDRENSENMKSKWRKMKSLVTFLPLHRKLYQSLRLLFKEINLEEVKSSVEDTYWQAGYKDYNFGGLHYQERQLLKETL